MTIQRDLKCASVYCLQTQIVGVFCTGSVSEGAWAFVVVIVVVVVVVSCIVQK
jgi:hypothetical protein